jgi:hypothetical protein
MWDTSNDAVACHFRLTNIEMHPENVVIMRNIIKNIALLDHVENVSYYYCYW